MYYYNFIETITITTTIITIIIYYYYERVIYNYLGNSLENLKN